MFDGKEAKIVREKTKDPGIFRSGISVGYFFDEFQLIFVMW